MLKHHVGDPIQYHADPSAAPTPGQIRDVHDDGRTCCLIAWCPVSKEFKEHDAVPHHDPLDGTGHFFLRPSEGEGN
jgi:hypothetical protein